MTGKTLEPGDPEKPVTPGPWGDAGLWLIGAADLGTRRNLLCHSLSQVIKQTIDLGKDETQGNRMRSQVGARAQGPARSQVVTVQPTQKGRRRGEAISPGA